MKKLLATGLLIFLAGCATLNMEPPQIALTSITPASTGGLDTSFNIGLRISNPNGVSLPIKGMSYKIALNGAQVLQGVTNQIPRIPAYGTENVTVTVGANLLSAPKLLTSLMRNPDQRIRYDFSTKIDLEGPLPGFNVVETGFLPTE